MTGGGFKTKIDPKKLAAYVGKGNLRVGIFRDTQDYKDEGEKIPSGFISKIVSIAYKHEFGLGVPRRPWLSASVKKDRPRYDELMLKLMKRAGDNETKRKRIFRLFGRVAALSIKKHIESNDIGLKPNAPSVQKEKGGSSPLIDSRYFVRHISYRVDK